MKRLFGTDGIRGVAGEGPLDRVGARRFGAALATVVVVRDGSGARVVLGRDTRESGPWLRDEITAGLIAGGISVVDAGVITTPGLAFAVRNAGFGAGVMISASHNPYQDNGLKVFGPDGFKLSDDAERHVEDLILDQARPDPSPDDRSTDSDGDLVSSYVRFLEGLIDAPERLRGLRVALDCANGASYEIAPEIFRHYGVETICSGIEPDGTNINRDCGSLHLDALSRAVAAGGCDLGLAFDGDADRVLAVDRNGRVVDGDHILYFAARALQRGGTLRGNAVVATIMSNLWLELRLAEDGIALHRAGVGDKYVLERMVAEDLVLGGEQSGHVIFRDHATTGDGIATGLLFLHALTGEDQPLEQILDGITPCPQILRNVNVRQKPDLRLHSRIGPAVAEAEESLGKSGRIVLRYSGTEPLARVMVEGRDPDVVREHADRLAQMIEEELGI